MSYNTNEVIRRGTSSHPRKRLVGLLWVVFRLVYVVGKIFDLIKWIMEFFGE